MMSISRDIRATLTPSSDSASITAFSKRSRCIQGLLRRRSSRLRTARRTFSFRTYYSRWLSAQYGGGGNVNAIPTGIGDYEKFKIIDLNGGDLLNGDAVEITAPNGMYVSAVNGGGANVVANVVSPSGNETFTIDRKSVV